MLHQSYCLTKPISLPRFNLLSYINHPRFSISHITKPNISSSSSLKTKTPLSLVTSCSISHSVEQSNENHIRKYKTQEETLKNDKKDFWGAVSLIIGTAVGPGMLGLPAATIRSGSFPSSIAIFLCWVYVISSIILVAELSFAAMQEDGVEEVSFTSLATKALGYRFGALVSVIYASLSFSLLVACVSGIGSIVSQWFPWMNLVLANALFPIAFGILIIFFPFKVIDTTNRLLCFLMLLSITALVSIGLFVARTNVLGSFAQSSWRVSSILPAIPVTVLTLGFHVITPFICKIAGNSVTEARKAVLIGGAVPLVMVLSWNLIVLGLSGVNRAASLTDPISLLLSVNPSALPAVQGFAFSALATSLIGYAVSFPKQLLDTLDLVWMKNNSEPQFGSGSKMHVNGRVGFVVFSGVDDYGSAGRALFHESDYFGVFKDKLRAESDSFHQMFVTMLVLSVPILIGSFFPSTFSRALDYAGVYANCFLFGMLPPVMANVQQSRKKLRSSILPGGDITLLLLFGIAAILGIWH